MGRSDIEESVTDRPWRAQQLWAQVAAELRGHRARGLAGLLTEDTVRFATAKALVDAGVDPQQLRVECPHPDPVLRGSRLDLVVGAGTATAAYIELKFPREPNEKNAAWTMALGEIPKDLYRLASCPGPADRLFVYVETERLRRYMAGAAQRYGLDVHAANVSLHPDRAAGLPSTAAQIIGADLARHHVTACRVALIDVDTGLRLSVYEVDPLGATPDPVAAAMVEPPPDPRPELRGARAEILDAAQAVLRRSGEQSFTLTEILTEMTRRGTRYPESTIRTMVTSHLCRNAPNNAATTYDDLERIDRARYRIVRGG